MLRLLLQLRVSESAAGCLDSLQVALPFGHRGGITADDLKASQVSSSSNISYSIHYIMEALTEGALYPAPPSTAAAAAAAAAADV